MTEIVQASTVADELLLEAINSAFEREPKTLDWFRWKHRSGPWGQSVGHAALHDGEVVGVRLFVPWRVRSETGDDLPVLRAMDGAVVPSARRQGLFSRLIAAQLESITSTGGGPAAVYSTSVPASRDAYIKLGWSVFDVPHRLAVPRLTLARVEPRSWDEIDHLGSPETLRGWATAWTPSALSWRTDPSSGHTYAVYSLAEADNPNGVVVRRTSVRGVPVAVIVHVWGSPTERRALAGAVVRLMRCVALWYVGDPGEFGRLVWDRGGSTVSAWAPDRHRQWALAMPNSWAYSFADLEGVM